MHISLCGAWFDFSFSMYVIYSFLFFQNKHFNWCNVESYVVSKALNIIFFVSSTKFLFSLQFVNRFWRVIATSTTFIIQIYKLQFSFLFSLSGFSEVWSVIIRDWFLKFRNKCISHLRYCKKNIIINSRFWQSIYMRCFKLYAAWWKWI